MMKREPIGIYELVVPAFGVWDETWLLLTAGEMGSAGGEKPVRFNSMTVSWGGLGFIWGKPLAMVVVRPTRYTFEFMERSGDFSLCAFGEAYREALNVLGVKSGRDSDKMAVCGLKPVAVPGIKSPAFAEAELVMACRKTYWQDLDPQHFLAEYIEPQYRGDYHRMYFGEVVGVEGTEGWRRGGSKKSEI
jgi:flavin reductase (DIM6/NTAB) family NADH-FMN oxidoreductase RutF